MADAFDTAMDSFSGPAPSYNDVVSDQSGRQYPSGNTTSNAGYTGPQGTSVPVVQIGANRQRQNVNQATPCCRGYCDSCPKVFGVIQLGIALILSIAAVSAPMMFKLDGWSNNLGNELGYGINVGIYTSQLLDDSYSANVVETYDEECDPPLTFALSGQTTDFAGRISIVSASPAGACRLGPEDDCFTDGAGNYGARESCTIRINVAGTLTATQFDTEPRHDTITIGGTEYNGDTGPLNVAVAAGTSVAWRTDSSVTADGWTICLTPDDPSVAAAESFDDCLDAQVSKCKATKAFSVIGPISIFFALYILARGETSCHKSVAKSAAVGFAFLGALSFLIVFSIAAANYNGAYDATSSCGLNLETAGFSYGPSFILYIVAFVLSFTAVLQPSIRNW